MRLSTFHLTTAVAALVLSASAAAYGQAVPYKIDKVHSEADFAIKHLAISTVHGRFGNIAGTVTFDPNDVAKSSVDATVDVTTVDTGVAQRDTHLKSPDFFDTAKYPTMTFKSKSAHGSPQSFELEGDLTMHGVTKPVTLHVEASKEQTGMDGKTMVRGFEATTTLHRTDFGLTWNGTLKSGDAALGDDVKVNISIEAGH